MEERQKGCVMGDMFHIRAETFDQLPWFNDGILNEWIARMLRPYGTSVCDVGAGTGLMISALADHFSRVVLVEPNAEMRAQLATKAQAASSELQIFEGVAETLPLADGDVDIVLSKNALHHCTDDTAALAEFARVAKHAVAIVEVVLPSPACGEYVYQLLQMKEQGRSSSTVYTEDILLAKMDGHGCTNRLFYHDQYIDLDAWIDNSYLGSEEMKAIRQFILQQPPEIQRLMHIHRRNNRLVQLRRIAMVLGFQPVALDTGIGACPYMSD